MSEELQSPKFQIFRAADAPSLAKAGLMQVKPFDDMQRASVTDLVKAGYMEGDNVRVLFNIPGFSLVHAWLKKDYPLMLHSHDSDCLYCIVAGTLKLGTEELGIGDGFFVPAGARYQYRPGANGVEVLEFRHSTHFDFMNHSKGEGFYKRALEAVTANAEGWKKAKRPSAMS